MRKPFHQLVRKAGAALSTLAGQVVVSVLATLSAGFVAQLVLKGEPAPSQAPAAPVALEMRTGAELLGAHFTEAGYRQRPAYPTEFAAVFGPAPGRPYREIAAAEWSPAPVAEAAAEKPSAEKPSAKPAAAQRKAMTAAILPPPRPASLAPAHSEPEPAPAIVAAAPQDERVRLLGVRLPGFVPSGERIVKTVASWGGAVTDLVPRL